MRKLLFSLCIATLLLSCTHSESLFSRKAAEERIANCNTFEDFTVPIRDGCTTYVTYGDDTLAVATFPITIKVPKQTYAATKSNENTSVQIDFGIINSDKTYSQCWQAVMFEDTQNGDYDYNDLIIHAKNVVNHPYGKDYSTQTIEIQPIALGSQKVIKLGCILCDNSEHIISENVRKDLFQNASGFINTKDELTPIRYKLAPTNITAYKGLPTEATGSIAWFIEVEGKRFFSICGDINYQDYNMLNAEGMPYGLLMPSTFSYPQEQVSIFETYPNFRSWINGDAGSIGSNKREFLYKYSYGGILGEDGKNHKIWDYKDLE